jgi:hypothetical protein
MPVANDFTIARAFTDKRLFATALGDLSRGWSG